jgi:hypothetical protein
MRRILAALCLCCFQPKSLANAASPSCRFWVRPTTEAPQVATRPPSIASVQGRFQRRRANAAAFNAQTKYIRIHCDAACSIRVNATATTSYMRIPLDGIEYFGVQGGDVLSIIATPSLPQG